MTSATHTNSRKRNHRRGIMAEYAALALLVCKGYRFVAWRYKTPVGEIDLIVRRGGQLVFVEVKARADADDAAHAVHAKNQSRVVRASQYFLVRHPAYASLQVRFDAVLIAWYRMPHHLVHAFGAP
jgi:putative endonuclease